MSTTNPLSSRVLGTESLPWREFEFIQQPDFKAFSAADRDRLRKSILANEFIQPFYVWRDAAGTVYCLDGFHRILMLRELEVEGVHIPELLPATLIECIDKKEAAKLVLLYSSQYAKITETGFSEFLDIYDLDAGSLAMELSIPSIGDIEDFQFGPIDEPEEDDYELPDDVQTDIQEGDLFEIGQHRLLCGSALEAANWDRLMAGAQAQLMCTDPPYNVNYEGKTADALTIENDHMDAEAFYKFLLDFFQAAAEATQPGAAWYVWHADSEGANFRRAMVDGGILLKQCLIWAKNSFVMGRQDYQWQHEPCLYGWRPGAAHTWCSDRSQSTVLTFDRPSRNAEHPTMKPVPLIGYLISNSSRPGNIVADGFGGSGTAMVASEQLKRRCRMMELSPKYCQVIVDRMAKAFPGLTIRKNGHHYEVPIASQAM